MGLCHSAGPKYECDHKHRVARPVGHNGPILYEVARPPPRTARGLHQRYMGGPRGAAGGIGGAEGWNG